MSLQFVIDGYNVINHPQFQPKSKRLDHPQAALLAFIRNKNLTGSRRNKIILVFDGFPPAGGLAENEEIIFSRKISADEKIKRIVEESAGRKNIIVVSDDKEIKFTTRGLGAKWLAVAEFIGEKEKSKTAEKKEPLKQELNYSQVDAINKELAKLWLKKQD